MVLRQVAEIDRGADAAAHARPACGSEGDRLRPDRQRAAGLRRCLAGHAAAERLADSVDLHPRDRVSGIDHHRVEHVGLADEARHPHVGRLFVERARRADLENFALAHDDDGVGQAHRLRLVVGDVDRRDADRAVDVLELRPHLLAQLRIEVRQRLVEQQDLRRIGDGAGERDALLLAARELVGIAVADRVEPHLLQSPHDLAVAFGAGHVAHLQAVGDVLGHRHVRPHRVALEHHAEVALVGRHRVAGRRIGDETVAEPDRAAVRLEKAGDQVEHGGLAAAGRSQHRGHLAVLELDRDAAHRRPRSEALAKSVQAYACHVFSRSPFERAPCSRAGRREPALRRRVGALVRSYAVLPGCARSILMRSSRVRRRFSRASFSAASASRRLIAANRSAQ